MIPGYRDLKKETLDEVGRNKVEEEILLRRLDDMSRLPDLYDARWLAIARTHFEQAYMALNRSITKPSRLTLTGDPR
jgi:hypothetical protein